MRARKEAEYQTVRTPSLHVTINSAALPSALVLLSVIFPVMIIGRDITRSNRYRRRTGRSPPPCRGPAGHAREDDACHHPRLQGAARAPSWAMPTLLSRLTVDERQRFYLDNMKTSSEHLLKLVVDLLDFHQARPCIRRR